MGDLHGESTDAAGGAVDQHFLARNQLALVAQRLQRRDRCNGNRGGLFEAEPGGLQRDPLFVGQRVLAEGPEADAEDFVARLELGDPGADGRDDAGEVRANPRVMRLADPAIDRIR